METPTTEQIAAAKAYADDIRKLAQFIENNPALTLPSYVCASIWAHQNREIEPIRAAIELFSDIAPEIDYEGTPGEVRRFKKVFTDRVEYKYSFYAEDAYDMVTTIKEVPVTTWQPKEAK